MTGYTVHTGSTEKFSEGWDRVFSAGSTGRKTAGRKQTKTKSTVAKKRKKSAKS